MNHVMIDIETLDTVGTAVIVSIGAAMFDVATTSKPMIGDTFYSAVSIASQHDRTRSEDTIAWWGKQPAEAQAVFEEALSPTAPDLSDVLVSFSEWVRKNQDGSRSPSVWGNGATFDNVIVRHAYAQLGIPCPWHFSGDRCYRTLNSLALIPHWFVAERTGPKHHALEDALYQARRASMALGEVQALRQQL